MSSLNDFVDNLNLKGKYFPPQKTLLLPLTNVAPVTIDISFPLITPLLISARQKSTLPTLPALSATPSFMGVMPTLASIFLRLPSSYTPVLLFPIFPPTSLECIVMFEKLCTQLNLEVFYWIF